MGRPVSWVHPVACPLGNESQMRPGVVIRLPISLAAQLASDQAVHPSAISSRGGGSVTFSITKPIMPAIIDPIRIPIRAESDMVPGLKASSVMNNDIVKLMPPSKPTPKI
jgi:hypothetical protein